MNPIDNGIGIQVDKLGLTPSLEKQQAGATDEASFQELLKGMVDKVDSLQKDADESIKGLASGEDVDIHDVSIKMQEAGVAFDLMMQIRNKLMEAYKEIIKMQP